MTAEYDLLIQVIQNLHVPLVLIDQSHFSIEYANSSFEELVAIENRKLIGTDLGLLFSTQSAKKIEAIYELMSVPGRTRLDEFDCELVRRSGRRLPVNLVASSVEMDKKRYILISAQDLSYTKKLQIERERHLHDLAQVSKLADIGMLAAGVGHELNNPLMIIQGFLDNLTLLMERPQTQIADLKRPIQQIQKASERMARIIKQMSRMVRTQGFSLDIIDLREVLHNVLQFLDHQIQVQGLLLTVESPLPALVRCDSGQLEQVILNVMTNAIHAVENLTTPRRIHIKLEVGEWVDLSIWNNGPAIPQEIQDKIMTPFFTTKDVGKGTGLGLPVSIGIMKAHHGSLRFTSRPGQGTQFTIRLPTAQNSNAPSHRDQDLNILIFDPVSETLEPMATLAESKGLKALKAQDLAEAYTWLQDSWGVRAVVLHIHINPSTEHIQLIKHVQRLFQGECECMVIADICLSEEDQKALRESGCKWIYSGLDPSTGFEEAFNQLKALFHPKKTA